jgi:hypothetical protein
MRGRRKKISDYLFVMIATCTFWIEGMEVEVVRSRSAIR